LGEKLDDELYGDSRVGNDGFSSQHLRLHFNSISPLHDRGTFGICEECQHRAAKSAIRRPEGGFSVTTYGSHARETEVSEKVFLSGRNRNQ
jgi:uncharacterized protein YlaI